MKTLTSSFGLLIVTATAGFLLAGCRSGDPADPPVSRVIERERVVTKTQVVVATPAIPSPSVVPEEPAPAAPPSEGATQTDSPEEVPLATVGAQRLPLPPLVGRVVGMAQRRVGDAVLLEFIKNATNAYELSSDQVVYLKDLGISDEVLVDLVKRGNELRAQGAPLEVAVAETAPAPEIAEFAPAPVMAPSNELEAPAPPTYAASAPVAAPLQTTVTQVAPPTELETVTQPVTEAHSYWYPTLSPYGSWMYLGGYGWCWQPTVAVVDPVWQPYSHGGRWLWSDSGWYWNSSYSWGWAPFHYGRWHRSPGCGWVWVPGSVWGPAWVTWRTYDSYCGWAPLPPAARWSTGVGLTWYGSSVSVGFGFNLGWSSYTFVPYHRMHSRTPHHYAARRQEATTIYNNSTVINNVIYGNNNTIVNQGVAPTRVEQASRQEVPKVRLQDVRVEASVPRRPERLSADGTQLAVYRPSIPTRATSAAVAMDPPPYRPERRNQALTRTPGTVSAAPSRTTTEWAVPLNLSPSRATTAMPSRGQAVPSTPSRRTDTPSAPVRREVGAPPRSTVPTAPTRTAPSGGVTRPAVPTRTPSSTPGRAVGEAPRAVTPSVPSRPITTPPAARTPGAATPAVPTPRSSITTPPAVRAPSVRTPSTATPAVPTPRSSITTPAAPAIRGEPRKIETPPPRGSLPPKYGTPSNPNPGFRSPTPAAPQNRSSMAPTFPARSAPRQPSAPSFAPPARSATPPARSAPSSVAPAPAPSRPSSVVPSSPAPSQPSGRAPERTPPR
ncbi:MAG: DUF6600 domain-containing protein [Limisphaerales bacterium]